MRHRPSRRARERHGGMQPVRLAAESRAAADRAVSMLSGFDKISPSKRQHLVGADDEGSRREIAHRFGLGAGQHLGDVLRLERISPLIA